MVQGLSEKAQEAEKFAQQLGKKLGAEVEVDPESNGNSVFIHTEGKGTLQIEKRREAINLQKFLNDAMRTAGLQTAAGFKEGGDGTTVIFNLQLNKTSEQMIAINSALYKTAHRSVI